MEIVHCFSMKIEWRSSITWSCHPLHKKNTALQPTHTDTVTEQTDQVELHLHRRLWNQQETYLKQGHKFNTWIMFIIDDRNYARVLMFSQPNQSNIHKMEHCFNTQPNSRIDTPPISLITEWKTESVMPMRLFWEKQHYNRGYRRDNKTSNCIFYVI